MNKKEKKANVKINVIDDEIKVAIWGLFIFLWSSTGLSVLLLLQSMEQQLGEKKLEHIQSVIFMAVMLIPVLIEVAVAIFKVTHLKPEPSDTNKL